MNLTIAMFLQIKRIRYTIPIFPLIALMAAYGLGEMQDRRLLKQVVISVVVTSAVVAYMGFLPFLQTLGVANLQAAGNYLNSLPGVNAEIVSLADRDAVVNPALSVPMLDIYTSKRLVYENVPVSPEILEKKKAAPLRFTWEFPLPEYYFKKEHQETDALVIISGDRQQALPQDVENIALLYPKRKYFQQSSNIFKHQTFVTVYHK